MTKQAVSLEELKLHLRVDHDFEDDLIESYAMAATEFGEQILNREIVKESDELAVCEDIEEVPQSIKTWIKLYTDDLFRKRGISESAEVLYRNYDHLLDRFILWNRNANE